MARATKPVSIAGIEFDALISEDRGLTATVPQYSVEDGFTVSDSVLLDAELLSMTLFLTETPVTWYKAHGASEARVSDVLKKLEELYYAKEPVTIVTSDNTFTDMAIESVTFSKSTEVGYAREIPISFRKIRKTSAKTTSLPASYGKSGATGQNAGTANTSAGTSTAAGSSGSSGTSGDSSSGSESKSSILYSAASAAGIL